ncbi:hypothetical protein, conserved [Plasmodium ovale wallikeri]|uniref:Uncharacterized protein n=1 Tax=Plasmodium ovale wallikeri TaxID=864142 RepID=A0A1A8YXA7_PLAOA|nr:hypothetical protein, conserved [Plasmodium ovale wallikeri]
MNGKDKCVKVITCKNSCIRHNLPNGSRKDALGRNLFFSIFKNKKNIFSRRKNRKGCRDMKENLHFGNSFCKETKWENDNSVLSKAYVNLKSNFVLLSNDSMDNITGIAMRERCTCIEEEKQKEGVIPSSYSYKDSALENDSLGPFDETRERSKLLQFQLEKRSNNYTNLENGEDEKMKNNLSTHLNTTDIDYVILKEHNLEMYKNDNNNFEELCFGNDKENVIRILKRGSLGDVETGEKDEKRGGGQKGTCENSSEPKKSYKTLRGSLKMDYLFKDSCELMENNIKSNDSYEYYYYNKFKNFQYGKHYNNKDNILSHHRSMNFTTIDFGGKDVPPPVKTANATTCGRRKEEGGVHNNEDLLTTHITPVVIDMDEAYRGGGEHIEIINNINRGGKHGGYENFYNSDDRRKEYKCTYQYEYTVEGKKTEKDYNNSFYFSKNNFYNEDMFRKNLLPGELNKRSWKPLSSIFYLCHYVFHFSIINFLETVLKSFHKTFFYMPIYILVTKVYIKNIHNLMCSFYSSILDASSFASYYIEYLILSYYNIEDSKNVYIVVYIIFLILHLSSLVIISKLKKA